MAQPSVPGNGPWLWASDRSHAATPTAAHTRVGVSTGVLASAAVDVGIPHRVRGRWICFLPSFSVSDRVWPQIVRACREGALGPSAKASTVDDPLQPPCVVVYVKDAADALDAERVRNSLRALGLSYPMVFMPDPDDVSAVGGPAFATTAPIRVDTAQPVPAASASATAMAGSKRRIPEAGFGPVPEGEPRRVHGGSLGWAAAQPVPLGSTLQRGGEDPSECTMGLDDEHAIVTSSSRKFGRHELSPPRFPVPPASAAATAASPFVDARYAQVARRQLLAAAARRRLGTQHPFGSSSWSQ